MKTFFDSMREMDRTKASSGEDSLYNVRPLLFTPDPRRLNEKVAPTASATYPQTTFSTISTITAWFRSRRAICAARGARIS